MSFRHTKFDDSEVMRSFARVGVQKGLVEADKQDIVKQASKKISATKNVQENILLLCASLRESGFTKHAEDLESNFLAYKQAQSLYETFKEKGEDLIDMAHPDGSHKLEGLDHKVLTVVDRHNEIKEKVNKKPTGKLASKLSEMIKKNANNKNILKVILAQEDATQEDFPVTQNDRNKRALQSAINVQKYIQKFPDHIKNSSGVADIIKQLGSLTSENIENAGEEISRNITGKLHQIGAGINSATDRSPVTTAKNEASQIASFLLGDNDPWIRSDRRTLHPSETNWAQSNSGKFYSLQRKIRDLLSKLTGYKVVGAFSSNSKYMQWIEAEEIKLNNILLGYSKLKHDQINDNNIISAFESEVSKHETAIKSFYDGVNSGTNSSPSTTGGSQPVNKNISQPAVEPKLNTSNKNINLPSKEEAEQIFKKIHEKVFKLF
jgi:hypothetical protein